MPVLSFVSDKPAYEAGPGKHGHVVKPHAALFERVARSSAVDLARQSLMPVCLPEILGFGKDTFIYLTMGIISTAKTAVRLRVELEGRCCLCILCFWRPTIIDPFFIEIKFIL